MKNWPIYVFILILLGVIYWLSKSLKDCGKELTACGKAGLEECQKNAQLEQQLTETNT